MSRRGQCTALAIGALLCCLQTAFAQSYPTRPVRVIVPFTASGPTDILARLDDPSLARLGEDEHPLSREARRGSATLVERFFP